MRRARAVLLAGLAAAAALVLLRARGRRRRQRVDLYGDDGSLVTFDEQGAEGARLLALAREVVRAAS